MWVSDHVHERSDQTTSYWTGVNILKTEHKECTQDAIGYVVFGCCWPCAKHVMVGKVYIRGSRI